MNEPIHRALGLTDEEAASIERILGREPNRLELSMYSVMWSEHCSYKSSRIHLRRLPTEAPHVMVGPGDDEGAGVIDAGDGIAIALRIESHNHPSAVEPYQGAATGVGGILRDIFSMGARPIAVMDPLRFGPLDDPRSHWITEGVVSGISGYGNSVGVPTVGGELVFDESYAENPLVNVLCLGVMPKDRLVRGRATGAGNLAVLLGSTTGRDGIGGVSVLASAGFGDAEEEASKRPSVQVGDPFEEKRLIEACLQLLDERLAVGVQDLGGAGLTCATSETAAKGGSGMDVYLSEVAQREPGMEPFEVMTSESQERMLAIVAPENLDRVLELASTWEVRATVVGTVTTGGRLRILDRPDGTVLADIPAASLHHDAPLYDRPKAAPADLDARRAEDPNRLPAPDDCTAAVLDLLFDPGWAYRQYDHMLFLNTVEGPGGDAAVLRLKAPGLPATKKGIALSTDGNGRWCSVDPRRGAANLVAESTLNVACAGARPVALVNCLNFGNPEHPEVMWQFSEAVDGMADACRALKVPVIGGNVSFYNESRGRDIHPTPVMGVLGLIDDLQRPPPGAVLTEGAGIVLLGHRDANLAGSAWAYANHDGHLGGQITELDAAAHARLLDSVRAIVVAGLASGIHDISEGGLGVALAEMAVRGGVGFVVAGIGGHRELFSESPSRVLVATDDADAVLAAAQAGGVPAVKIGRAAGDRLVVDGLVDVTLAEAASAWREALPERFDQPVVH